MEQIKITLKFDGDRKLTMSIIEPTMEIEDILRDIDLETIDIAQKIDEKYSKLKFDNNSIETSKMLIQQKRDVEWMLFEKNVKILQKILSIDSGYSAEDLEKIRSEARGDFWKKQNRKEIENAVNSFRGID